MKWGALLWLAACGGESIAPDAFVPIDAPPFVPGPNTVRLSIVGGGAPEYIRYRNGDSGWTAPQLVEPDVYELHITDAYDVVMVCGDEDIGVFDTEILYRTFADGEEQSLFCFPQQAAAVPSSALVTGQMQQAGELFMRAHASSLMSPWTYQLSVERGTHDLIAVGFDAIAVRRDQVIDADRTLDVIDLDQEGAPLIKQPITVNAGAGEIVDTSIAFFTPRGFARIAGTATQLRIPPASLVQPGDFMQALVEATRDDHYRAYQGPPTTEFTLLPSLDVVFSFSTTQIHASWTTLPQSYRELDVTLFAFGSGVQLGTISATKRWIDATGTRRVSFEDVPPDFDHAWLPGLGVAYDCDVSVHDEAGDARWVTGVRRSMGF